MPAKRTITVNFPAHSGYHHGTVQQAEVEAVIVGDGTADVFACWRETDQWNVHDFIFMAAPTWPDQWQLFATYHRKWLPKILAALELSSIPTP